MGERGKVCPIMTRTFPGYERQTPHKKAEGNYHPVAPQSAKLARNP